MAKLNHRKLTFVGVIALAPASNSLAQDISPPVDSALFATVVHAADSGRGPSPLRVDPRPIWLDQDQLEVNARAVLPVPGHIVQARTRVLAEIGLPIADAVATGLNEKCPGIFVGIEPRDSVGSSSKLFADCPRERFTVLAVGLGRRGTLKLNDGNVYDVNEEVAALGYWAVRVLSTQLGPRGAIRSMYDFILAPEAKRWRFIKAVPLSIVE